MKDLLPAHPFVKSRLVHLCGAWSIGLGVMLGSPTQAIADESSSLSELPNEPDQVERPWAKGISEEDQRIATEHFAAGNTFLKEGLFQQAIKEYEKGLEHWHHPGIHYNLALATLALNDPIRTHDHLVEALRFGPEPLDPEKFEHAQKYLALINQQLTTVRIVCQEPGAEVRLDGQLLFRAPGRYEGIRLRGEHTVTASKPGFETAQVTESLEPDDTDVIELKLYRPDQLIGYRRRWAFWGPVAVTGAGLAVLTAGPILTIQAQDRFRDYDAWLAERSDCQSGCVPPDDLAQVKTDGQRLRTWSAVAYIAGGVATTTGVALMIRNRKISYRLEPEELERRGIALLPAVGPGSLGIVGTGRF